MASAQRNPVSAGAIKKIARDLISIPAGHEHVFLGIPFDSIAGKRNRGVFLTARKPGPLISGEPVIQQKAIPAAQIQAISCVEGKHRMPDTETPCAHQACSVATKSRHLALLDSKSVFMLGIFFPVDEDSMNIVAQSSAVKSEALNRRSACVGEIQQAGGISIQHPQYTSTGTAVVPRRNANQGDSWPHVKFMGSVDTRRQEHGTAHLCGIVKSTLQSRSVVSLAIAGGSKFADVEKSAGARMLCAC